MPPCAPDWRQFALAACLLNYLQPSRAQSQSMSGSSQGAVPCPTVPHHGESPSDPEISISDVTFSGFIQMPILEQDKVIATIKQKAQGTTVDGVVEEALERIKAGWRDRGYFKVEVSDEATRRMATKTANNPRIALFVHVDENPQFRLGGIAFKNNRAISNLAALRSMVPIK